MVTSSQRQVKAFWSGTQMARTLGRFQCPRLSTTPQRLFGLAPCQSRAPQRVWHLQRLPFHVAVATGAEDLTIQIPVLKPAFQSRGGAGTWRRNGDGAKKRGRGEETGTESDSAAGTYKSF